MDLEYLVIIIVSVIAFILLVTVIVLLVLRNRKKVNPLALREFNDLPRDENGRIDPDAYEEWRNNLYQRNPKIANQIGVRPSERYQPPDPIDFKDPGYIKRFDDSNKLDAAYIKFGYYLQPGYEKDRMRQEYEENARRERASNMNDYRARY